MMAAKKAAIIGLFAAFVVAGAVAASVILVQKNNKDNNNDDTSASHKAIQDLCQNTYYQQTCIDSLTKATNSSDIKSLIQAGFQIAMKELGYVIKKLPAFEAASKVPETAAAYKTCQKFLDDSINDLQRTFDRTDSLNIENLSVVVDDIKTWLTGALTYQETCLDRFKDAKGDAGAKMREILKPAREITVNGLAMANIFSKLLEQTELVLGRQPEMLNFSWPDGATRTHKLLRANPKAIKPHVVVAKDGSGKYRTINEALREVPYRNNDTFVIYIKEGVYEEYVNITSSMWSVMLIGDGPTKTKITGNRSKVSLVHMDTYWTATVVVEGDNFIGRDIGFENTAGGEMHQAVALLVAGDKSIFYNCQIDGYQDTLCTHAYRQFYRDCTISGTVDFIFGNGMAVLQNCTLIVRRPLENQLCMVTAQGKTYDNETSALVLQSCRIVPALDYPVNVDTYSTFLGRPWKPLSKTIVMDSQLDAFIDPKGWAEWRDSSHSLDSCWFAEVNNQGPGANLAGRVKSPGIKHVSIQQAEEFTPGKLLGDYWIAGLGIPYSSGRMISH